MADTPEVPKYPLLFKHMALAIYKSGDLHGGAKEVFESALQITLSRLAQYRLIAEYSTLGNIVLTSTGRTREAVHRGESDKNPKTMLFDKLYSTLYAKGEKTAGLLQKTPAERAVIERLNASATPTGKLATQNTPDKMTTAAAKAQKSVPKKGLPATTRPKIVKRSPRKKPARGHAPKSSTGKARKPRTGTIRPVKNKRPLK